MDRRFLRSLVLVTALTAPAMVTAKLCGDDVGGQDVPCACGDVVASDVVLRDDPIVHDICATDGLIVRALQAPQGVTVDLNGHTLRGSGKGVGVLLLYGGKGGAQLISRGAPATIDGFYDGILGRGTDSVARIDAVIVTHAGRDGIRLNAINYLIHDATVIGAGRDGFLLGGSAYQTSGTRAIDVKRYGYFVTGENATVGSTGAGAVVEGSGNVGINVMGSGHRLLDCAVSGAGKDGVILMGTHLDVRGCTVTDSHDDGIGAMGNDLSFGRNRAANNGKNGIVITGMYLDDLGGNDGSGNHGGTHPEWVKQCEIDRRPCQP